MKNLIKRILREQLEDEEYIPIPKFKKGVYKEGRVFEYLDNLLGDLKKRKPKYYDGFVFTKDEIIDLGVSPPMKGIIGYDATNKDLFVTYPLLLKLIYKFNLGEEDRAKLFFKEWFEDKFQFEISDTITFYSELPIDWGDDEIFEYLDNKFLNKLENQKKSKYYDGIIIYDPDSVVFPNRSELYDKEYGILGLIDAEDLTIYHTIVHDVILKFKLENVLDGKSVIGRWFSSRMGVKVNSITDVYDYNRSYLAIDEKILREQQEEEEEYIPIPKWNYEKKYKDVYNYLDNKGLVKRKPKYYEGIVFAYPDEEFGILGWEDNGTLFIYYDLIEEIYSNFNMDGGPVSRSIIGKWVSDRYQLEVKNTYNKYNQFISELAIRYQLK